VRCGYLRGFAHGFIVLYETADLFYKCDELYKRSDEFVAAWDDAEPQHRRQSCPRGLTSRRSGQTLAQLHASLPRYAFLLMRIFGYGRHCRGHQACVGQIDKLTYAFKPEWIPQAAKAGRRYHFAQG